MTIKRLTAFWASIGLAVAAAAAEPAATAHFPMVRAGRTVTIWYHAPAGFVPGTPVVIVMHGVKRNADDYLRDWTGLSDRLHFIAVCPEFSQKEFPGEAGYIYGNTVDSHGRSLPREQWAFSVIEPVFDAVKGRLGLTSQRYSLFGHSAGAQFVQRFVYFVPEARIDRAVAANAGWYLLPDFAHAFPYGLKGTPVTRSDLRHALSSPLTILLGESDTDAKDPALRHTPEAEAQGPYRFARGKYFFARAEESAAALGAHFGWTLGTAPGIGHSDAGMAPFAVKYLLSP
jgi:poly(3-hydroxybutyrate) depolymerase